LEKEKTDEICLFVYKKKSIESLLKHTGLICYSKRAKTWFKVDFGMDVKTGKTEVRNTKVVISRLSGIEKNN